MQGQFSAYINIHTGIVNIVKSPNDFEYKSNDHFSPISCEKVKRDIMEDVSSYWEENYVPEENRILVI